MEVPFPSFYQMLWLYFIQRLTAQRSPDAKQKEVEACIRFALGLPRGHAKTTFIKLFVCYCILYDLSNFILIVCANEPLAQNVLEDIHYMLSADTITSIFGSWQQSLTRDTKSLKRSYFNGKSKILAALGAGSSLRGLNIANRRPDFILLDDVQTRECAFSKAENEALRDWLFSTLLKARDLRRAFICYIGNMYNDTCILAQLQAHPQWETFITGAILQDWTSLWPEMYSVEALLAEYEHDARAGLADIWFAEVMNIPVGSRTSLLPNGKLPECPIPEDTKPLVEFITVDPAGYRKHSDDNVIVRHAVWGPEEYSVREIVNGIMNPGEVVETAIEMAVKNDIFLIGVETVAYQQALKWHIEQTLENMGLDDAIQVVELRPRNRSKLLRIQTFIQEVLAGRYHIEKPAYSKVLFQALGFRLDRNDNKDDILDCCAYGIDIRNEYGNMLMAFVPNSRREKITATVIPNNSFLDRS